MTTPSQDPSMWDHPSSPPVVQPPMVIVAPVIPKSPTVGCTLQLIFGCLGIGRFYIGSIGLGATQLGLWLFGWVLWLALAGWIVWIPLAIWALADAIYIGVGSAKNSQGVPIK